MLDALVAACQAALRVGALPDIGGLPPQLHVTIELAELRAESPTAQPSSREQRSGGAGYLVHAGQVPTKLLRRLACDADVIPIVLGGRGEVLDMGRRSRLATPAVRRALISRDGGCLFPGCTVPATWTEAHHVVPWYVDGTTDVNQMVLLCPYHHHAVHTGRWVVEPEGPDHRPGPGQRPRPFRLTTPWSALPDLTRNLYHLGA